MLPKLRNVLFAGTVTVGLLAGAPILAATSAGSEQGDRARFMDDKGHYRPDWRAGVNRPAHVGDQAIARRHETVGEWIARAFPAEEKAPYALTGQEATARQDSARFTDSKGHHRPDWRAGINAPRPESRD